MLQKVILRKKVTLIKKERVEGNPLKFVPRKEPVMALKNMLKEQSIKTNELQNIVKMFPFNRNIHFVAETTKEQFSMKATGIKNDEEIRKMKNMLKSS